MAMSSMGVFLCLEKLQIFASTEMVPCFTHVSLTLDCPVLDQVVPYYNSWLLKNIDNKIPTFSDFQISLFQSWRLKPSKEMDHFEAFI